jgi:hypothetical protein
LRGIRNQRENRAWRIKGTELRNTFEDVYAVYEGQGIVRFSSTDGTNVFKCWAKHAVSPFCQFNISNMSIGEYCDMRESDDVEEVMDLEEDLEAFNSGRNA